MLIFPFVSRTQLKTTVKNSKLTEQHYWLNRVKIARHAALEFNRGWSFVEEFTRCGFSVYGRVHKSRLHFKLRSFLEERGWDGISYDEVEETSSSEDEDSSDRSSDPDWQPPRRGQQEKRKFRP